MKLLITGKMGSGKSLAANYLVSEYSAQRWSRTELMKRLAHAVVDHTLPPDPILEKIFPEPNERDAVRSDLLRYSATYMPEFGKPRRLYQDVTEICQEYDPLCFEQELQERIDQSPAESFCLVDDVRKVSAFEYFVDHGFRSLRIEADEAVRRERILRRDGYLPSEETFTHSSETELDGTEHEFVLWNNEEDLRDFYQKIDQLMKSLL